jgi:hypothetical protein
MDVLKDIQSQTNVEYLTQLDKFIDIDISNIDKNSLIAKMVAESNGMTLKEYNEKRLIEFQKLKDEIQKRITELTK